MPVVSFDQLPNASRLWIFAAARELEDRERELLLAEVDKFLAEWTAHRAPVTAGRDWCYNRFLFIGVTEEATGLSGCSIDALVRSLKGLEATLSVGLVDTPPVCYRDGDRIVGATRERFAELVAAGAVTLDTQVFDNTLATVGQLRKGRWEVPASEAWHARAFFPSPQSRATGDYRSSP